MVQLLDQYGRPIEKSLLRRELAGPTLTGVRPTYRSYHLQSTDPSRIGYILREAESGDPIRYLELAEEMEERDLHYLSVLNTRRRQVAQLKLSVEPADESDEAEKDAALLREWLKRQELADELYDLLDAIGKGFAVCEIMWDFSESQWMPAQLEYRLPAWFRYDYETGARLQRRDDTYRWVDLEPGKFVIHEHSAKSGIAIRGGLARCVAWAWAFKNFGIRDWLRFIEAYGHPLRIGKYDKGTTEPERDTLLRAVGNVASDFSAIIPEGMALEFVQSQGTGVRSDLYQDLLAYMDAAISKAVLGQTLTTQEGDSGSYSLGQVHDGVRADIERSDARQLAATLTNAVGRSIVLLNRGHPGRRGFPRFVIGREDEYDPAAMAEALSKLLPHGLRVKAQQVRRRLGLDDPEDDDEVLTGSPPAAPGNPMLPALARALARRGDRERDAVELAVDRALEDDGWHDLMQPSIGPVLQTVSRAGGYDALLAAIDDGSLFEDMDTEAVATLLTRLTFSADLSGDAGLDDE